MWTGLKVIPIILFICVVIIIAVRGVHSAIIKHWECFLKIYLHRYLYSYRPWYEGVFKCFYWGELRVWYSGATFPLRLPRVTVSMWERGALTSMAGFDWCFTISGWQTSKRLWRRVVAPSLNNGITQKPSRVYKSSVRNNDTRNVMFLSGRCSAKHL